MLSDILQVLKMAKEFGVVGYLALFLGIGVFVVAIWLVKHIVQSSERERANNQLFLSEAVGANTRTMGVMTDRLGDVANLCGKILENLSRIENADRYQREEHKELILILTELKTRLK